MNPSLTGYYARRANEYELIYRKPERQSDLGALRAVAEAALAGHDVLELACGTGYWTAACAPLVSSIHATDVSPEVLELARSKACPSGRVRFALADAYTVDQIEGRFTAAFAGFWWSHVPRERLAGFLHQLHRRLGGGSRVVFCDNRYVEGSSTPVARRDDAGNTFQQRRLQNGDTYEVLKNFPGLEEVFLTVRAQGGIQITGTELEYYWCVSYLLG